jgi:hypothetical protein
MIVWAGRDSFALTLSVQNTGGAYDPATDGWALTNTATAPAGRMGHTAVWSGNGMIVWGGILGSFARTQTGGRYSVSGDTWAATSVLGAPTGRAYHAAVWTGTEMVVWGGSGVGFLGDGGAFDPATNAWRALPTNAAPTAREDHTAVWTGTEMIIWGGATSPADTYLNSGAALTP